MTGITSLNFRRPEQVRSKVAWSCVVDDTPQIWSSLTPWLATATGLADINPARIYVHHACPLRPEVAAVCETLGVNVIAVAPFDARSPHSNKIRQCETDFGDAERVVLTDVDIAFARIPPLGLIVAPIAGKLVDAPNPPIAILDRIFAVAGIARPVAIENSYWTKQSGRIKFATLPGNFNGGLYVIDAERLRGFGARWAHWARWLLEHAALLDKWRVHVDQISFCLALAESGYESEVLTDAWNFPTHLRVLPGVDEPILLHHHGRLDSHMRLEQVDAPEARPAIARVNDAIEQFQRRHFDNRAFWNHRYAHHQALGSGLGSRGESLQLKQALLAKLITTDTGLSVLDWGCGDLETTRELPCQDYVGVDVAVEALWIARDKRPDWQFATPLEFDASDGQPRDVVLCLDVLIHQPSQAEYLALIRKLVLLARYGALIAGFDREPDIHSHITYFHEPLGQTLAGMPGVSSVVPLLEYRGTTLYLVATGGDSAILLKSDELSAFARDLIQT